MWTHPMIMMGESIRQIWVNLGSEYTKGATAFLNAKGLSTLAVDASLDYVGTTSVHQ